MATSNNELLKGLEGFDSFRSKTVDVLLEKGKKCYVTLTKQGFYDIVKLWAKKPEHYLIGYSLDPGSPDHLIAFALAGLFKKLHSPNEE